MQLISAIEVLNDPASYFQHGWLAITAPNLVIAVTTLVLFILALLLPFPHDDVEQ